MKKLLNISLVMVCAIASSSMYAVTAERLMDCLPMSMIATTPACTPQELDQAEQLVQQYYTALDKKQIDSSMSMLDFFTKQLSS